MKRGFTLLEVIVAGSVLFIVASAVVGLSNTIIQGTVSNSDQTIMSRWSSEGLELVQKIRDENILKDNQDASKNRLWLDQAASVNNYGWYYLESNQTDGTLVWSLTETLKDSKLALSKVTDDPLQVTLKSDQVEAYRLICIESVGAGQFEGEEGYVYCNAKNKSGAVYSDGSRSIRADCDTEDVYCLFTKTSLNTSNISLSSTIIPAGNAVKIRSLVVWSDKANYKSSDTATILTNWQGYGLEGN